MTDSDLIDLLGGPTVIAKELKISPPAVCMWRKYGIPTDKRVYIAAEIEKQTRGKITRKMLFPDNWYYIWPEI